MILRYSMPSEEDKQKAVERIFKDLPPEMASIMTLE
jgi:uncharacterized protein YoaH (UPF0181 family)